MQAVILAGGLGTRLRNLTKKIPKPMVLINKKPYLEYQLNYLYSFGINDILLLTGYLASVIEDYFGDGKQLGLDIKYSVESEPLGTGGALRNAVDKLKDEFFLIYGDSFLPIDYNSLLNSFTSANTKVLLSVFFDEFAVTDVNPNIAVDSGGYVIKYSKNTRDEDLKYIDAGVLCCKKDILSLIDSKRVVSFENDIFPKLIKDNEIKAFFVEKRFYDIGTLERLKELEGYINNDNFKNTV